MWASTGWKDYELLDCGKGEKLERWGSYTLVRPDPQAIWNTPRRHPGWKRYDARYSRSHTGGGQWVKKDLPQRWQVRYGALTFNIKPMNFKHTGLFPEQAANWDFAMEQIRQAGRPVSVLNLFAYTGAATLACAAAGASVCHVDAARGWSAGPGKTPKALVWRTPPSAGLWTTAPNLWSGKSVGAGAMTPLLWTPLLRPGALRGSLEAGGEPIPLCGVGHRCAVRPPPLFLNQLLHHGACPVGADLPVGNPSLPPIWRQHRQ